MINVHWCNNVAKCRTSNIVTGSICISASVVCGATAVVAVMALKVTSVM